MTATRAQSMHFPYLARDWTYTYNVATCNTADPVTDSTADCSNWAQYANPPIIKVATATVDFTNTPTQDKLPWTNTPDYFVSDYHGLLANSAPDATGKFRPARSYQKSVSYTGANANGVIDPSFAPDSNGNVPLVYTAKFCTVITDNTCPGGEGPFYGMSALSTPGIDGKVTYEDCGVVTTPDGKSVVIGSDASTKNNVAVTPRAITGATYSSVSVITGTGTTVQGNLNNAELAGRALAQGGCNGACCFTVTTRAIYEPSVAQFENFATNSFIYNAHVLTLPTTDMTLGQISQSQDSCAVSVAGVDFPADLSSYVGATTPGVTGWSDAAGQTSGVGKVDPKYLQKQKIGTNSLREPITFWPTQIPQGTGARRLAGLNNAAANNNGVKYDPSSATTPYFSAILPLSVGRIGGKGWNTNLYAHMMPIGDVNTYDGNSIVTKYTSNPVLARSWADLPARPASVGRPSARSLQTASSTPLAAPTPTTAPSWAAAGLAVMLQAPSLTQCPLSTTSSMSTRSASSPTRTTLTLVPSPLQVPMISSRTLWMPPSLTQIPPIHLLPEKLTLHMAQRVLTRMHLSLRALKSSTPSRVRLLAELSVAWLRRRPPLA